MSVPGRRRCAVLGSPVAHSLSPRLHRAAYAYLGLDWAYDAIDVTEDALPAFIASLDPSWRGLSVTMPLKQAAAAVATRRSDLVVTLGAANTLVLDGAERVAENTDVPGIRAALAEAGLRDVPAATVLGSGSTAVAAVAALASLTSDVTMVARSPARAGRAVEVAGAVGVRAQVVPWAQARHALSAPLVVATTPAGATDSLADMLPARPGTLFDVLYDPWPTPLASAWQHHGGRLVGGRDLLVWQAVDQVHLMTGRPVPVSVLRAALTHR